MSSKQTNTKPETHQKRLCPECLAVHAAGTPHDRDSLFYNCTFFTVNGRWPTWSDAVAHCSQETRIMWGEGVFNMFKLVQANGPYKQEHTSVQKRLV